MFLFTFSTKWEKQRVLDQRPWNIKRFHMVICSWPPGLSLLEVDTKMSIFGMQIHGLPLEYMTNVNAEKICAKIRNFIQFEKVKSPGILFRHYMRIQVEINVENPLPKGFPLIRRREPATWVSLKYERLSKFCYCCGCLVHLQQVRPSLQTKIEVSNYGPWKRAEKQTSKRSFFHDSQLSNASNKNSLNLNNKRNSLIPRIFFP